jgi:hypothetical protein
MSVVCTDEIALITYTRQFSATHDEKKNLGMVVDDPLQGIFPYPIHKFIR